MSGSELQQRCKFLNLNLYLNESLFENNVTELGSLKHLASKINEIASIKVRKIDYF